MKNFADLTEREVLAVAISSEEEDSRIYMTFAEDLKERYPDSAKLFEQMADSRDEVYALMRELGDKRRAVRDVLTSEPFDPEAAALALSEARDARARLEQRTEALILEAAETLPADVRRAAFERALTRRDRGDRRDRRRDGEARGDSHRPPHGPPPGDAGPDLY